jgi:hypothetical protein
MQDLTAPTWWRHRTAPPDLHLCHKNLWHDGHPTGPRPARCRGPPPPLSCSSAAAVSKAGDRLSKIRGAVPSMTGEARCRRRWRGELDVREIKGVTAARQEGARRRTTTQRRAPRVGLLPAMTTVWVACRVLPSAVVSCKVFPSTLVIPSAGRRDEARPREHRLASSGCRSHVGEIRLPRPGRRAPTAALRRVCSGRCAQAGEPMSCRPDWRAPSAASAAAARFALRCCTVSTREIGRMRGKRKEKTKRK